MSDFMHAGCAIASASAVSVQLLEPQSRNLQLDLYDTWRVPHLPLSPARYIHREHANGRRATVSRGFRCFILAWTLSRLVGETHGRCREPLLWALTTSETLGKITQWGWRIRDGVVAANNLELSERD